MRGIAGAVFLSLVAACTPAEDAETDRAAAPASAALAPSVDSGFLQVPDSAWVDVVGPTIIAFHPVVSNDSLEKDEGLASALDDLSYHLGSAMDTLTALGAAVHYRGGDTVWARAGSRRARFVRAADSADVGYVFADTALRVQALYGVRGSVDLVDLARELRRTGRITHDRP